MPILYTDFELCCFLNNMLTPVEFLEVLLEDLSNFGNVIWVSQLLIWGENVEESIISI